MPLITKVETRSIQPEEADKIIYKAYNTVFNEPKLPEFSFQEVFAFLNKRDYIIVAAKGMAKTTISESTSDMEVIHRDGGYNEVEDVFAVKNLNEIPLNFSSEGTSNIRIKNVFIRELKNKILYE